MNPKLLALAALKQSLTYLDHPEVIALGFAVHPQNCANRVRSAIELLETGLSEDEKREFRLGGGELGQSGPVDFEVLSKNSSIDDTTPDEEDQPIEQTPAKKGFSALDY